MKYLLTSFAIMLSTQFAFSMTNLQLTAKVMSNTNFLRSVEADIRNTFRRPEAVKLQFISVGAQLDRAPYFLARFEYNIKSANVQMGLCAYTVLGILKKDSLIVFDKIVHEDCGE